MTRRFYIFFFSALFLGFCTQRMLAEEMLKKEDVRKVMDQILKEHRSGDKGVSRKIVQAGLSLYIRQFDRDKIYLLEDEVKKYQNLSDNQYDQILSEYKNNDFRKFEELNNLIINAIRRAKGIRHELLTDSSWMNATGSLSDLTALVEEARKSYAKTPQDLKKKIQSEMLLFIREKTSNRSPQNVANILKNINAQYEYFEKEYLSVGKNGKPLPENEKQNLFYMHILKALASALDSHTNVLNSNEAFNMKVILEKGFQGVGIVLKGDSEGVSIGGIMQGSPAEKNGQIRIGDRILSVNNESVESQSPREVIEQLRDVKTPAIELTLSRKENNGEKKFSVSLKREFIEINEGRVDIKKEEVPGGQIGILALHAFYQGENGITSEKDIRNAIQKLKKEGNLKGIILDLRSNGGGFLNQAVKVAGLFLTNGVVVVSKYTNGEERFFRDMDGKTSFDGPLIVLVSKLTASAAEIVSQSLQDYGLALVVGDEHTYGKGTVQTQTVTDGESAAHFKVTVGKYYTVSGKTPQITGVRADIVVPGPLNAEHIGEEYLQNHLASDTIASSYNDAMSDIAPNMRPWYLRYYMPTLQRKENRWDALLPTLKTASQRRIANNPRYRQAIEGSYHMGGIHALPPGPDYQLEEAVNIMKDMIQATSK